jgi:hypothetical protein
VREGRGRGCCRHRPRSTPAHDSGRRRLQQPHSPCGQQEVPAPAQKCTSRDLELLFLFSISIHLFSSSRRGTSFSFFTDNYESYCNADIGLRSSSNEAAVTPITPEPGRRRTESQAALSLRSLRSLTSRSLSALSPPPRALSLHSLRSLSLSFFLQFNLSPPPSLFCSSRLAPPLSLLSPLCPLSPLALSLSASSRFRSLPVRPTIVVLSL